MPSNFIGPYVVQWVQSSNGLQHSMQVSCQVDGSPVAGQDPATIDVIRRDSTFYNIITAVTELMAVITPLHPAATTFGQFELYKVATGTNQKTFITSLGLSFNGTGAGSVVDSQYTIYNFKTVGGSTMRITMLEGRLTLNDQRLYAALNADEQALVDYIEASVNWVYARDNSYPIAFIQASSGQNEAIWRKRNR